MIGAYIVEGTRASGVLDDLIWRDFDVFIQVMEGQSVYKGAALSSGGSAADSV